MVGSFGAWRVESWLRRTLRRQFELHKYFCYRNKYEAVSVSFSSVNMAKQSLEREMSHQERRRHYVAMAVLTCVAAVSCYNCYQLTELRLLAEKRHNTVVDMFGKVMDRENTECQRVQNSTLGAIQASKLDVITEILRLHRRQEQIQVDIMASKLQRQRFENGTFALQQAVGSTVQTILQILAKSSNVIVDHLTTLKSHLVHENATVVLLDEEVEWGHASSLSKLTCQVEDTATDVDAFVRWRLLDSPITLKAQHAFSCQRQTEGDGHVFPYRGLMKIYLYDESGPAVSTSVVDWFHVAEVDMQLPMFISEDDLDKNTESTGGDWTAVLPSGVEMSKNLLTSHWFSRTLRLKNLPAVPVGVKVGLSFRQYGRVCNFSLGSSSIKSAVQVSLVTFATWM